MRFHILRSPDRGCSRHSIRPSILTVVLTVLICKATGDRSPSSGLRSLALTARSKWQRRSPSPKKRHEVHAQFHGNAAPHSAANHGHKAAPGVGFIEESAELHHGTGATKRKLAGVKTHDAAGQVHHRIHKFAYREDPAAATSEAGGPAGEEGAAAEVNVDDAAAESTDTGAEGASAEDASATGGSEPAAETATAPAERAEANAPAEEVSAGKGAAGDVGEGGAGEATSAASAEAASEAAEGAEAPAEGAAEAAGPAEDATNGASSSSVEGGGESGTAKPPHSDAPEEVAGETPAELKEHGEAASHSSSEEHAAPESSADAEGHAAETDEHAEVGGKAEGGAHAESGGHAESAGHAESTSEGDEEAEDAYEYSTADEGHSDHGGGHHDEAHGGHHGDDHDGGHGAHEAPEIDMHEAPEWCRHAVHGHAHHHACDPISEAIGTTLGWMLLGGISLMMGGVYTLTYPDPQVFSYATKCVFQIVCIFVALLWCMVQDELLVNGLVKGTLGMDGLRPDLFGVLLYFVWFGLITQLGSRPYDSHDSLHAVMGIVAHIAAFTAMHPLEHIEEHFGHHIVESQGFVGLAAFYLACPVLLFGILRLVSSTTHSMREKGGVDRHTEHILVEAENESSAIITGFMLTKFAMLFSTGQMPSHDCDAATCNHSRDAMYMMLGFAGLAMVILLGVAKYNHQYGSKEDVGELIDFAEPISSFFLGFMILTIFGWAVETRVPGGHAGESVVAAAMCAPLLVVALIAIDRLADQGVIGSSSAEAILSAVGLAIGLQWEVAFHSGLHVSLHSTSFGVGHPKVATIVLAFFLAATLLPAWRQFVVPVASRPIPQRGGAVQDDGHGGHGSMAAQDVGHGGHGHTSDAAAETAAQPAKPGLAAGSTASATPEAAGGEPTPQSMMPPTMR
eukprot:TRINITY_DN65531_c0_g1_i1.p1 TRINITY_DN65531_c0_g1~~TRINITY_DN65531_c0_g1_i1.p1  ORF type:complete len:909 (+),score=122.69 TRINITY_DN65531_c0_g1_i1:50-2776(+)